MSFGISIEDLENSESAIVENFSIEESAFADTEDTPTNTKTKNKQVKNEDEEEDIESGFSLAIEDLIEDSLEGVEDAEDESDDNETPAVKSTKKEQKTSSQETFTSLASALVDAGVFSSLEEEDIENIKDAESILDAIAKEIKAKELADLTDEQKEYVKALRDGVPHDTYSKIKTNIAQYKKLTDEQIEGNPTLQYQLHLRSFMASGTPEEKAKKLAMLATQSEDSATDAIEAKNALVAHEEGLLKEKLEVAEKAKAEKLENETKELNTLKSKINETAELIPGIKVNAQTKAKVYDSMVSPVNQKGDTLLNEVMEAYGNQDYKIKLHALHVITKGFTDFSKFISTQKSEAIKNLENKLKTAEAIKIGGNNNNMTSPNQGKTSEDLVKALRGLTFNGK